MKVLIAISSKEFSAPTLSAGISYEIEHYDYLFGYFIR